VELISRKKTPWHKRCSCLQVVFQSSRVLTNCTQMQIILNGIISGFGIALLAIAFQTVYLPTRVFFMGLAGIYAAVPFVCLAVLQQIGSWWLALPVSVIAGVAMSALAEAGIHMHLEKRNAASGTHLIASLGAYIVFVQSIAMIWGNNPKSLRQGLDTVTNFGDVIITGAQWITLLGAVVAIGLFVAFLSRTNLGLRMRALADNPFQFALYGHTVAVYRFVAFGLAGGLAAIGAIVTAYDIGFDVHSGLHALLLAVVAVIVGGRSTFIGPLIGGLILGIVRSQVVWHLSARWQEAVSFGLLAIVLIVLPNGLLGSRRRLESQ
jgi:branched-chain amino acid transport system permease protein